MQWLAKPQDILGIRFALNVSIATAIVWYVLRQHRRHQSDLGHRVDDRRFRSAGDRGGTHVRSRLINVLVGGVVGLLFLLLGGPAEWTLPLALPSRSCSRHT